MSNTLELARHGLIYICYAHICVFTLNFHDNLLKRDRAISIRKKLQLRPVKCFNYV